MIDFNVVQADVHSLQASMMKGKTMAIAACVSVCALGAEAIFVPMLMDRSYDHYIASDNAPIIPVQAVKPVRGQQHYIPLAPINAHGQAGDAAGKSPVS